MAAIFRREFSSYFTSPMGYIFLAAFYACAGLFFSLTSLSYGSTDMSTCFTMLHIVLLVLLPILTMKTLADEKRNKTDQCLLTAPVSLFGLVFGKFLAAFLVYALGVAITFVHALVISAFVTPEWPVIIGNIVGLLLIGAAYISIGIFVSSLTENQVVSAVISFVLMVIIYLTNAIAYVLPAGFLQKIVLSFAFATRYEEFTYGVFDISNVVFFLSVVAAFLFLTIRVLEKRRWG